MQRTNRNLFIGGRSVRWSISTVLALGGVMYVCAGVRADIVSTSLTATKDNAGLVRASDAITVDADTAVMAIGAGAVVNAKLAADAVTSDKIKNGEVKADDIASAAVVNAKIADGAVTTEKIATDTITFDDLSKQNLVVTANGTNGAQMYSNSASASEKEQRVPTVGAAESIAQKYAAMQASNALKKFQNVPEGQVVTGVKVVEGYVSALTFSTIKVPVGSVSAPTSMAEIWIE